MLGADVDEKLIGKFVKLVFDDGEKPFRMQGKILGYNSTFLIIFSEGKEHTLPLARVIRIEVSQ